ncbi:hypothetical protein DAETH_21890 [Deinococcus aetherius]|uniref:DUF2382 domain-containing protein n=1 Tax=Deinococcus aetherius TaxID=200252 RepID=A0ABN6RFX2_9DEIO|nr:DUF2382 domain-containing protein [Deinococcus aetherius]BDP42220.1 hypothetical protein DAETH_21890 [Deinococcus aetherius]
MTQGNLIRLSDLSSDQSYGLSGEGVYNPSGNAAYGQGGDKIGTVRDALVDPGTGRIRYLILDVGGWFSSKEVVVPVGHARFADDGVYFDNLTKDQVRDMSEYRQGETYTDQSFESNERVLRGASTTGTTSTTTQMDQATYREQAFRTPDRLQLLEERLMVNKERFQAGSVEIGKRVETHQETLSVPLQREEVVIERHAVTDGRPVEGNVTLGAGNETLRVDLEAERAQVAKQAYVTEEVEIGKRTVTETQQVTETVGREVLEVNKTGDVEMNSGTTTTSTTTTDTDRNRRS